MANFDVKCPDHYPMKCNLSPADHDYLVTEEKYKAFFIAQYEDNDEYLEPVLRNYFEKRTWKLFYAGQEPGTGTKFCKVCKFALASDFGIASLSPLNNNVFQEIGLMQGLQKPLLYLYNPALLKGKLPFDVDDKIYVKHTSQEELEKGLDREIPLLIKKVELYSEYQKQFRGSVQQKVDSLTLEELEKLKFFLIENRPLLWRDESMPIIYRLEACGFIMKEGWGWEINPEYRDVLREIVFKKENSSEG